MTFTPLIVGNDRSKPPSGWEWKKLSDIAKLESGHTPSRKRSDWWGGDVPWIALADIRKHDGKYIQATDEYTNSEGLANSSARLLPESTVVMSRTASVGFVAIMGRPMATSQDFVNWVCGDELNPRFLMHLLIASRTYLLTLSSGAVHRTIYMPAVKAMHVCVPHRSVQDRIACELDHQLSVSEEARIATQIRLDAIQALPSALRRSAFNGEL